MADLCTPDEASSKRPKPGIYFSRSADGDLRDTISDRDLTFFRLSVVASSDLNRIAGVLPDSMRPIGADSRSTTTVLRIEPSVVYNTKFVGLLGRRRLEEVGPIDGDVVPSPLAASLLTIREILQAVLVRVSLTVVV